MIFLLKKEAKCQFTTTFAVSNSTDHRPHVLLHLHLLLDGHHAPERRFRFASGFRVPISSSNLPLFDPLRFLGISQFVRSLSS
jgi:hypothetical protein